MNFIPLFRSGPLRAVAILLLGLLIVPAIRAERLRIAAAATTSGPTQSYDGGQGGRILQGVKPDIVLIQEFLYGTNSSTDIRSFVTKYFDASFSYSRGSGALPTGIISRYPIKEAGEWTDPKTANRTFSWARIEIPGGNDLWAVSVHFSTAVTSRPDEAQALVSFLQANVPAGSLLVVGGDFNSDSTGEAQLATLDQAVETAGTRPVDQLGNFSTNGSRTKPYDAVFSSPSLTAYQIPVTLGSNSFSSGLVVDTRVYTPVSDLSPALPADSGAENMVHMTVVKDFQIPSEVSVRILRLAVLPGPPRRVSLTFSSAPQITCEIQASPDLAADNWTTLGQLTTASAQTVVTLVPSGNLAGEILDPQLGSGGRRFYRIVVP